MFILALMSVVIMLISGVQLLAGGAYLVGFSTIGFAALTGFMTHFGYKKFGYANSNQEDEKAVKKLTKWSKKLDCCDCDACDCIDCS